MPTRWRIIRLASSGPSIRTTRLETRVMKSYAVVGKYEVVTNTPLVARWPSRPADEIAHLAHRHARVGVEALGLHVDDVETERVLLDDAVDAAVADPAERAAHLDPAAAVAHPHQEIDDETLEKSRRKRMHPFDDFARQLRIQHLIAGSDRFLGILARLRLFGLDISLLLVAPGVKLRIALEHADVDLAHPLGEQRAAPIGGAAKASPRQFDEPRLREVGAGPVEPAGKHRLVPARQHARAFLRADAQGFDNLVLQAGNAEFLVPLPERLQCGQHELLKARHPHGAPHKLPSSPSLPYMRKTPKRVASAGA